MNKSGLHIGSVLVAGLAVFGWQLSQPVPARQVLSMVPPQAGGIAEAPPIMRVSEEFGYHSDAVFLAVVKNEEGSHPWNLGELPPVEDLTPADAKHVARHIRERQKQHEIF